MGVVVVVRENGYYDVRDSVQLEVGQDIRNSDSDIIIRRLGSPEIRLRAKDDTSSHAMSSQ